MTKQYNISGFNLYLPDDHKLEEYQAIWHLYDRALGMIAKFIAAKYPDMTAINIGANVGDTAALIQESQPIPTLCVEGNPEYFDYLQENAAIIGNIEIADCFIGEEGASVDLEAISSRGGTSCVVNAVSTETAGAFSQMTTLQNLLEQFPNFQAAKLLKVDTDGFDFSIIEQSKSILKSLQPIIYFEYDISFTEDGFAQALSTLELLSDLGYKKFSFYDNFGNHLISLDSKDSRYFFDLTNYLLSNRIQSGRPVVFYFDVCAFPEKDLDIFDRIYDEFSLMKTRR